MQPLESENASNQQVRCVCGRRGRVKYRGLLKLIKRLPGSKLNAHVANRSHAEGFSRSATFFHSVVNYASDFFASVFFSVVQSKLSVFHFRCPLLAFGIQRKKQFSATVCIPRFLFLGAPPWGEHGKRVSDSEFRFQEVQWVVFFRLSKRLCCAEGRQMGSVQRKAPLK